MNVPGGYMGSSYKPDHHNSFCLASAYCDFYKAGIDDIEEIDELIKFFSQPFCTHAEYKEDVQQKVILINDKFMGNAKDFLEDLIEFKAMLSALKTNPVGNTIVYRAILEKYTKVLMKDKCDPEMLLEACQKATAAINQQERKLENRDELTLKRLFEMDARLSSIKRRGGTFSISSGEIKEIEETSEKKISRLTQFFTYLADKKIMEDFQKTFVEYHYQENFSNDVSLVATKKRWTGCLLFSAAESEHREKFSAALEAISQRGGLEF